MCKFDQWCASREKKDWDEKSFKEGDLKICDGNLWPWKMMVNKRDDLTKRKNGHGTGCITTDRNQGGCAFKWLKSQTEYYSQTVFAFWTTGGKSVPLAFSTLEIFKGSEKISFCALVAPVLGISGDLLHKVDFLSVFSYTLITHPHRLLLLTLTVSMSYSFMYSYIILLLCCLFFSCLSFLFFHPSSA